MDWMNRETLAIPRRIEGFPYPERFCPYCDQPLMIENTCHLYDEPEHYKVLYQCRNDKCVFLLDNAYGRAYLRVYYSSEIAENNLWKMLLTYPRKGKNALA